MKFLNFAFAIGKLKNIQRTGWLREKIPHPEIVADHSFRTAVLAMILAPQTGANVDKSVKMALIHDIGEAKIGDLVTISPDGKTVNKEKIQQKDKTEYAAMKEIFALIDNEEYVKLFKEYQENKTLEAKFVFQIDKLERTIQAYEYEKLYGKNLQNFLDSVDITMKYKPLQDILDKLINLRK